MGGKLSLKFFMHANLSHKETDISLYFLPTFVWENPEKIHQILWKSNNICIELKTCKVTEYELNRKPPTYALKWIVKRSTPTGKTKLWSLVKRCLLDGRKMGPIHMQATSFIAISTMTEAVYYVPKGVSGVENNDSFLCKHKQQWNIFVSHIGDNKPRPSDWRLTSLLSANPVMTNTHWQHNKNSTGNLFSN